MIKLEESIKRNHVCLVCRRGKSKMDCCLICKTVPYCLVEHQKLDNNINHFIKFNWIDCRKICCIDMRKVEEEGKKIAEKPFLIYFSSCLCDYWEVDDTYFLSCLITKEAESKYRVHFEIEKSENDINVCQIGFLTCKLYYVDLPHGIINNSIFPFKKSEVQTLYTIFHYRFKPEFCKENQIKFNKKNMGIFTNLDRRKNIHCRMINELFVFYRNNKEITDIQI